MIASANPNTQTTQFGRAVPSERSPRGGCGVRVGHRVLVVPVAHLGAVVVLRLGVLVGVAGLVLLAPVRLQDAQDATLQRSANN